LKEKTSNRLGPALNHFLPSSFSFSQAFSFSVFSVVHSFAFSVAVSLCVLRIPHLPHHLLPPGRPFFLE